jgi:hypothetical protein
MKTWNSMMENERKALLKSMKPQAMKNTSGATIPEAKTNGAYAIHSKATR